MAGLQDTNVVDVVAQDADGDIAVIMVEDRPWGTAPEQVDQLRAKINAYAAFILDGSLSEHFPETVDKRVRIQLDCVRAPTGDIGLIIDRAAVALAERGIGFRINVQP